MLSQINHKATPTVLLGEHQQAPIVVKTASASIYLYIYYVVRHASVRLVRFVAHERLTKMLEYTSSPRFSPLGARLA